jgi:hypothetical protein
VFGQGGISGVWVHGVVGISFLAPWIDAHIHADLARESELEPGLLVGQAPRERFWLRRWRHHAGPRERGGVRRGRQATSRLAKLG